MPNTVYGTYRGGQIIFDAPGSAVDESRVKVVFLDDDGVKKNGLTDIFDVLGPWEDDRDTETIIAEIRIVF